MRAKIVKGLMILALLGVLAFLGYVFYEQAEEDREAKKAATENPFQPPDSLAAPSDSAAVWADTVKTVGP